MVGRRTQTSLLSQEPRISQPTAAPRPDSEIRHAARGGAATFVAAATSALLGFLFNILIARQLGTTGAGIVLQAIAVFTIVMSLARLGLDTTAVWLLPRQVEEDLGRVRSAVVGLLLPGAVVGLLVTAGWFVVSSLLGSRGDGHVHDAIGITLLFLPAAILMAVALASTRAFGGVVPFNLIENIGVPLLRPLGVVVAVGLGGGALAVTFAWSLSWLIGAIAALVVLARLVRRSVAGTAGGWRPDRALMGRIGAYSLPRAVAAGLEQSIIWLDVILVGAILGSSAAGVYGSAARFVAAGLIVSTAIRIVVAPRFSALLAQSRLSDVHDLYAVTARWILLFGAPIYLTLAVFAPTVLGWLGAGFVDGAGAMAVLCLGSLVVLAAGNVQSLLLMSGRSGWSAINKVIVVVVNLIGNIVLLPRIGIIGAALVWAFCMVLDTLLAAYQVNRATGISLEFGSILQVGAAVTGCVAGPGLLIAWTLGRSTPAMLLAIAVGGVLLLGYAFVDRRHLRLDGLPVRFR